MGQLTQAYHTLIDFEYTKYTQNERFEDATLAIDEAKSQIATSLRCSLSEAEKLLQTLVKKGFVVKVSDNKIRSLHFDVAYRSSNITIEYGSLRYPLETKLYIRDEEIPSFDECNFQELKNFIKPFIYEILEYALLKTSSDDTGMAKLSGFSSFQLTAIRSIVNHDKKGYILNAPTSGGKTFAFLIPALIEILKDKLEGGKEESVKVLLVYPRISLEMDQLNKVIAIIHRINYYLEKIKRIGHRLSIGIDDGATPWKSEINSGSTFRSVICPICNGELQYIVAYNDAIIRCSNCSHSFNWIYGYREQIWDKKPDILITNVWALDWRLPSKTIEYDYKFFNNLKMIVLDEAHVYQSLLGGNIRYILKRLRIASNSEPKIILSSATISKPSQFSKDLLDLPEEDFMIIRAPESKRVKKVIYLIMAVNPLRSWETVAYELAILLGTIFYYKNVQSVIFIDSIRELYRIFHQTRVATLNYGEPKDHFNVRLVPNAEDPYAFWHYANRQFDLGLTPREIFEGIAIHHSRIKDRDRIEKRFSAGELGVLMSTSTLELGVDYPQVAFIGIMGIPFMLESIPQRIGRAGRNEEKTLNTILAIIVLRNTPLELYYLYNFKELIDGFLNKDIPVAWRNIAVKRYHVLSALLDELARQGFNTYILKTDGRMNELDTFIEEITRVTEKITSTLEKLDSQTSHEEIKASDLLYEIKLELSKLPNKAEELRRYNESAMAINEILALLKKIARRTRVLASKINDAELDHLARKLFASIKRVI